MGINFLKDYSYVDDGLGNINITVTINGQDHVIQLEQKVVRGMHTLSRMGKILNRVNI